MSKIKNKDIANKVMQEIKNRHISMRPRLFFVVGSFLLVGGLTFTFILAIFLVHLILFRLRVDAPFEFLRFGPPGIPPFFMMFPWRFFLIVGFAVALGIYLLKKCEFSYKYNFALVTGITIIAIILTGVIVDYLEPNSRLERLPPMRGLYQERLPGKNWVAGEILKIHDNGMLIYSLDGWKVTIIWDKTTMLPMGRDFKVGESIRAFGEWKGDALQAQGIIKGGFLRRPTLFPSGSRGFPSPVF